MQDDAELLRRYAEARSEAAFAELVRRHLGLVYHAALRQCGGDPHRAEEVAQLVFTDLARKADSLARRPLLVAWLHTGVRYAASHLRRAEARRQIREQEACAMNERDHSPESDPAADWERLRPLIDDALDTLTERDRAAVLLRFFEARSYAEVAATLAVSEDAARVRVNRALDKLRSALARRGLVSTASALGLALAQPALAATPPSLAASITTASLAAAATGAVVVTTTGFLAAMSTAKIALTAVGTGLAVFTVGIVSFPSGAPNPVSTPPAAALSPAELAALLHPARLSAVDADSALAAYLALPLLVDPASTTELQARRARLRALLTILPVSHFERLLTPLYTRAGWAEDELRRLAFTAWTELAPEAADHWAEALVPTATLNPWQRARLVSEATGAWARIDFDAAHAWAGTIADVPLGQGVTVEILAELARSHPERALELAPSGDDTFARDARLAIFRAWSEKAPVAALRRLGPALFENDQQRWHLLPALQIWAGHDSAPALDWTVQQRPPAPGASNSLLDSLILWAPSGLADPGAFADVLASRTDLASTSRALSSYLGEWALRDASAVLAWLDRLPDPARRLGLIQEALPWHGWAVNDPAPYLPLALRLPPGDERDAHLTNLLSSWASADPAATSAWLAAHDGPEFSAVHARVQGALLAGLAATDPAAALARWEKLAPGDTKTATLAGIADSLANVDPVAAAQWFGQNLPALNEKERSGIGSAGYTRSLGFLAGETPAHLRSTSDTLVRLVDAWYEKDPAAAVAWAAALPDYGWQVNALFAANGTWNNIRDRASHADHLARLRPDTARDWVLREHLKNWFRADERATRAWLDAHPDLPSAITTHVLATQ